jgi:hypothetical protein
MENARSKLWRSARLCRILGGFLVLGFIFLSLSSLTAWGKKAENFEKLPVFQASKILPKNLLKGSNYQIQDEVQCDGFNYIYDIKTDYGPLRVESTALLKVRLQELAAIEKMQKVEETQEFQEAFANTAEGSAKNTINLAKGLVTNPTGTVSGIASGVGSYLSGLGRSIKGGFKSGGAQDESTWKKVIGFAKTKREVAYKFKVDPYSDYQVLQDQLDRISWAAFAGGKTFSLAVAMVPGGAGTAISSTQFVADMNQAIVEKSPSELSEFNADKLKAMGIDEAVAKKFIEHPQYTPTRKTYIVGALDKMKGVENRTAFLEAALLASNPSVAFYFQQQAIMYGIYHHDVKPLARFIQVGPYPFAETKEGVTVGLFPIDHLVWTEEMATKVEGPGDQSVKNVSGKGKTLLFGGTVSKMARKNLTAMGWKVEENMAEKLSL